MAKDTPKSSKSGVSGPVRQHYTLATTGKCPPGNDCSPSTKK